jgi:hypothetical protein
MKKVYLLFLLLTVVSVAELYLLLRYGSGSIGDKLELLFSVIGYYGIALGFIKQSAVGKIFDGLLTDMTSHHPALFVAGNFHCMGLLLNFISIGLSKYRKPGSSLFLGFAGMSALLLVIPVVLLYVVFHLLIILPLSYIPYLFSSAIVEAFNGASGDIKVMQKDGQSEKKMSLKQIISADEVAAKSFIVGVPAIIFSFGLKCMASFG